MEKNFLTKQLLKKELVKFSILFFILYIVVFIVLNVTGWLIRPEDSGERLPAQEQTQIEPSTPGVEEKCVFSEKVNSILIFKIGIEAPLVFPSESDTDFTDDLNRGVVHFPESKLPGEKGEAVFLGHSAPLGWPKIRYDWVFSDLNKLEAGDEIKLVFENCQYVYQVTNKYFLEKGEELPSSSLTNLENVLILISCWPPGKDIKRIAIKAVLARGIDKNN